MEFQSTKTIRNEEGKIITIKKYTYVRDRKEGEIRGSKNLRFARRNKVRAMKAAGHLKGDNRKWESMMK